MSVTHSLHVPAKDCIESSNTTTKTYVTRAMDCAIQAAAHHCAARRTVQLCMCNCTAASHECCRQLLSESALPKAPTMRLSVFKVASALSDLTDAV